MCQQEQVDIEDTAVPYKAEVVAQDTVPDQLEDTAVLRTVVDFLVSLVPCQPMWLLQPTTVTFKILFTITILHFWITLSANFTSMKTSPAILLWTVT